MRTLLGHIVHLHGNIADIVPLVQLAENKKAFHYSLAYRVLLCVCGRHVSVGSPGEGVRHVRFQHAEDGPFDHVVCAPFSPNSAETYSALPMLMRSQCCRHDAAMAMSKIVDCESLERSVAQLKVPAEGHKIVSKFSLTHVTCMLRLDAFLFGNLDKADDSRVCSDGAAGQ